jgi:hypothetical protein
MYNDRAMSIASLTSKILAVLLLASAPVCSQPPTPRIWKPDSSPQHKQTELKNEKRGPFTRTMLSATTNSLGHHQPVGEGETGREQGKTSAEWWLVGFTFLLAIFTGLLFWATWRLVKDAKESSKRQMRAYLSVVSVTVEGEIRHISAMIAVKNVGQTPARNAKVGLCCCANSPCLTHIASLTLKELAHGARSHMMEFNTPLLFGLRNP